MGQSSGAALAHDVAITPQMKGKLFNCIPLSGKVSNILDTILNKIRGLCCFFL